MGQTEHYGLHSPQPWDRPSRADYQDDMGTLDCALAEKAELVTGVYTGDGTAQRSFSLGFSPRAVLVEQINGDRSSTTCGGLAVSGGPLRAYYATQDIMGITAGGFTCWQSDATKGNVNNTGSQYRYLALR